jgi:hypothetical protein
MALDTTIAGKYSNSYLTVARATEILTSARLYADAWTSAAVSVSDQEAALRWATKLIDTYYEFEGQRSRVGIDGQALSWPRWNAFDVDEREIEYTIIPYRVEWATAELALELLTKDRSAEPGLLGLGFREAKVGSISVKVDPSETPDLIPDNINAILAPIGTPSPAASMGKGTYSAKVKRS